jgi:hypothetical protein
MANPQPDDAHLRIAHSVEEQIMVSDFTEQQRRILDLILRLSWGCGKKVAYIPSQSAFSIVGVRRQHIKHHLDILINAGVIFREGDYYQINKDYDYWRITRAEDYTEEKMAELVQLNLVTKEETPEHLNDSTKHLSVENVTKNVTNDGENPEMLRNTLQGCNEIRYNPTSDLASPKEILKKTTTPLNNKDISRRGISLNEAPENVTKNVTNEENGDYFKIHSLYLEKIGSLTPGQSKELEAMAGKYSLEWFEAAIQKAVIGGGTKLSLAYVKGTLEGFLRDGGPRKKQVKQDDRDTDKYFKGKYGHVVKH